MDKAENHENHPKLKCIAFDPREEGSIGRLRLEIEVARLVRRQDVASICYLPEVRKMLLLFKDAGPLPPLPGRTAHPPS